MVAASWKSVGNEYQNTYGGELNAPYNPLLVQILKLEREKYSFTLQTRSIVGEPVQCDSLTANQTLVDLPSRLKSK